MIQLRDQPIHDAGTFHRYRDTTVMFAVDTVRAVVMKQGPRCSRVAAGASLSILSAAVGPWTPSDEVTEGVH